MNYKLSLENSTKQGWWGESIRLIKAYPILIICIVILNMYFLFGQLTYSLPIPSFSGFADFDIDFSIILFAILAYVIHSDILMGKLKLSQINYMSLFKFILLFFFVYHIYNVIFFSAASLSNLGLNVANTSAETADVVRMIIGFFVLLLMFFAFPLTGSLLPDFVMSGKFNVMNSIKRGFRYFWRIIGMLIVFIIIMIIVAVVFSFIYGLIVGDMDFADYTVVVENGVSIVTHDYVSQVATSIFGCAFIIVEARLFSRIFLMDEVRKQDLNEV